MATFASYLPSWMTGGGSGAETQHGQASTSEHIGSSGGGPKIWPLAPQTAQELRKGVSFNMKVVIRGLRGTGKTTLFSRLCNLPVQATYTPSQEISAGTIRVVGRGCAPFEGTKVDVWDVVDEGKSRATSLPSAALPSGQPFKNQQLEALAALPADARNVDVYKECQLALFLIDPRRRETLSYAVTQARSVPQTICVFLVLNFADTNPCTHEVTAEDMDRACRQIRRTSSRFLLSLTEGHPVPPSLSTGASWTPLSALTGLGVQRLYLALNVPITALRAALLERQLQELYQQMQWPTATSCATEAAEPAPDHHASSVEAPVTQAGAEGEGVPADTLRLEHRRTEAAKPAQRRTDAHGIEAGFFGSSSSDDKDSDGEDQAADRARPQTASVQRNPHVTRDVSSTADAPGARERLSLSRPQQPRPAAAAPMASPAHVMPTEAPVMTAAAAAPAEVAALVSDHQGPDASFFTPSERDSDHDAEDMEEETAAERPAPNGLTSALLRAKPLTTQRVARRSDGTGALADQTADKSAAATLTVDVSALAAQMQAALATAVPDDDHTGPSVAKAAKDKPRSSKSAKKKKTSEPRGAADTAQEHEPECAADPSQCDDGRSFEVLRD